MESNIKITKMEKDIILSMQQDESKRVQCAMFWNITYSFNGKTIPFKQALKFIHSTDLFWKSERNGDIEYYSLTDLGKSMFK